MGLVAPVDLLEELEILDMLDFCHEVLADDDESLQYLFHLLFVRSVVREVDAGCFFKGHIELFAQCVGVGRGHGVGIASSVSELGMWKYFSGISNAKYFFCRVTAGLQSRKRHVVFTRAIIVCLR